MSAWWTKSLGGRKVHAVKNPDQGMVGDSNKVNVTNQEIPVAAIQEYDRFTLNAAAFVDTYDISHCDEVVVRLASDGTTDILTITASVDGVNFDAIPSEGRDQSGALVVCVWTGAAGGASFAIPFNAKKLRFTSNGATDTFTIGWSARNSGRGAV